jgi:hypothetical protein
LRGKVEGQKCIRIRVYLKGDGEWQADTHDGRHAVGPTRHACLLALADFLDATAGEYDGILFLG